MSKRNPTPRDWWLYQLSMFLTAALIWAGGIAILNYIEVL